MRFTASCLLSSWERPRAETPGIRALVGGAGNENGEGRRISTTRVQDLGCAGLSSAGGTRRKRSALAPDAAFPRFLIEG